MKILRVSCSPSGQGSESNRLSQRVIEFLQRADPTAIVVDRDVGSHVLPPIDTSYAISQRAAADVAEDGTAALSAELIDELTSADVLVIGTPMHNYTVPATLKAWIDHIARVRFTFDVSAQGKIPRLRDRPVFIAVSSAGRFSGPRARQPDFLSPYLRAILGMIGLVDLRFFSVEGTGLGEDVVAASRTEADRALTEYFSSFRMPTTPARP